VKTKFSHSLTLVLILLSLGTRGLFAQGTAFTYQGQLNSNGAPATGIYDFGFITYDALAAGIQQGPTLTPLSIPVTNGVFTVTLDFGNVFTGADRWLAIYVRTNGAASFTLLSPRQKLTPTPYAVTAASVRPGGITEQMLGPTAVTTDKIAAGSITTDKIATGAVKPLQIDDGGEAAYVAFQQTIQPVAASSIPFQKVAVVTPTNSVTPVLRFTINGAGFGSVLGYSGSEDFSKPYSFTVQGTFTGTPPTPDSRIGTLARLDFTRNGKTTAFSGIVTAFAYGNSDAGTRSFTARFEPTFSYLGYSTDYQVFQNKSIPQIVSTIYTAAVGASPEFRTSTYPIRETVIQYAESDFNFFNRLLEYEGVFYFTDYETGNLVLGDDAAHYNAGPAAPIPYYGNNPSTAIPAGAEYIRAFQKAAAQSTLRSTVDTYDFQKSLLALSRSASGAAGVGENYEFGSTVKTTANNQRLANVRMQRQAVQRATMTGSSTVPDLHPGYTFTLDDKTTAGLAGAYVVTSVKHGGFYRSAGASGSFFYGNEFEAIPATMTFRPAISTPVPRAEPATAIVTGPAGEKTHVDDSGRVKVQFHWDRYGLKNEQSSAFIRVANPVAGLNHSMMFLPDVGDEVLVSFVQGDPDQPIIVGSLYNDQNPPPLSLPTSKTISVLQSRATNNLLNGFSWDTRGGLILRSAADLGVVANGNFNLAAPLSINNGTPLKKLLAGQIALPPVTTGPFTSATISFPSAFASAPRITVTPSNDPNFSNVNDTFTVTVRSISTTACVVNVVRVDASGGWSQSLRLNWMAWE
jgi:type VI secretion system VgrG family protein